MSLVINRIVKKRSFDLLSLDSLLADKSDEILNFVKDSKESVILLPNLEKWFIGEKKEVNKLLKDIDSKYPESIEDYKADTHKNIKKLDLELEAEEEKELLEKFKCATDENKSTIMDTIKIYLMYQLEEEYKKMQVLSKNLDYLNREINLEVKETGISNLYLAYGLIEGKFTDGSNCRAPLCLLPLEIKKINGVWKLLNTDKKELEVNKVFLFSGIKNNEIKGVKNLELDLSADDDFQEQFIKFYKDNGLVIQESQEAFTRFPHYTAKESYKGYTRGELCLKNHLILGRFPTSNAIYEDYAELIKGDMSNQLINALLKSQQGEESDAEYVEKERDLKEHDFYFLSNLDYSQELTLKRVEDNNSTVIFGPPGTGKSETIANVISDALAKGKRVLMVSQKKAALDVIYNRLSSIGNKLALIHDAEAGKKEFYLKINELIAAYEEGYASDFYYSRNKQEYDTGFEAVNKKIENNSTSIEASLNTFRNIHQTLYKERENGQTLQNIYHLAWSKESLTEEKEAFYKKYSAHSSSFSKLKYSHNDLLDFRTRLIDNDIVENYITATDYIQETPLFLNIKETPDFSGFYEFEEKLEKHKEKLCGLMNSQEEEFTKVYEFYKDNHHESELKSKLDKKIEDDFGVLKEPVARGLNRILKMVFKRNELIETEKRNLETYEMKKDKYSEHFKMIDNEFRLAKETVEPLNRVFSDNVVEDFYKQIIENGTYPSYEDFQYLLENYDRYLLSSEKVDTCNEEERKFLDKVKELFKSKEEMNLFIDLYPELTIYDLVSNKLKYDKEIRAMEQAVSSYETYKKDTHREMNLKIANTKEYILKRWDDQFLKTARADKGFVEFKRLSGLKRRHKAIRQYMETYSEVLLDLFPCFLMGPETVSKVLPLNKDMFDLVIFDEASQMYVEDAIPSLLRAKKAVVAGDDMQLKPSGLFSKKYMPDDEDYDAESAAAIEEESLLDLAKISYYPSHLNFHYRSRYAELINFSNYAFYNGKLKLAPNKLVLKEEAPITRILVKDAMWENRSNKEEALVVVENLKRILKTRKENETIGIITFNITQRDLIQDLIEVEIGKDNDFREAIHEERERLNGDEDVSLFIKNIENVQGDERDLIIFSTGYAKNEKGKLVQHFGSLSQSGGENRLNVAVSRAKKKVIVITSFEPEELRVENSKQIGPLRFKQYLQYARAVDQKDEKQIDQLLKSLATVDTSSGSAITFDSPFEMEVYEELQKLGYDVHTQVGASGYLIDLAIYDAKLSQYVLAIECDGRTYHSSPSARERDIHRQKFLEARGWKFQRIWSSDWWMDRSKVMEKLKRAIDEEQEALRKVYKS